MMRYLVGMGLLLFCVVGCGGDSPAKAPTDLRAAWLGEGTFTSEHGSQAVKAQLELLPDDQYRFLILEPRVLMLAGLEQGTWSHDKGTVSLTPVEQPEAERTGILKGAPRNFRAKELTVSADLMELKIHDDQLEMTFTRNEKATEKLRERGDL